MAKDDKLLDNNDVLTNNPAEPTEAKEYFVNIEGEDVKVNCKSDSEYSCLLNCLEGYYIYGIGREDDDAEDCDDGEAECGE